MSTSASARASWLAASLAIVAFIPISIAYIDRPLAIAASELAPSLREVFERITVLGDSAIYVVPTGVAAIALYTLERREGDAARKALLRRYLFAAFFLFAAVAVSGLATDLLKILLGRARPSVFLSEGDFGWHPFTLEARFRAFPSGHANTVVSMALALGFLLPRARVFLLILAALVALTRIAVEAHYLSDIIAGSSLAFATTIWLRTIFARHEWLFRECTRSPFIHSDCGG